jgi:hypothetical protein
LRRDAVQSAPLKSLKSPRVPCGTQTGTASRS